ncbi:DUF222 domain-containing protein [Gordonia sp. CPCC 205515]|uniref:HNH endonuclease signature motif containing protein n=1 Tax=Gordonia sp. CPCC 205515 TaxID=3140791 RepID=UPI003AF40832
MPETSTLLLDQLREDEQHTALELIEILHHCAAVCASADFRMLQAASLIHDEREEDYLAAIAADAETGQSSPAQVRATALRGRAGEDPRGRYGPNGLEAAIAEVGAALTVPPARARELVIAGSVLRYQLPLTGGMLACGRIDLARFLMIVKRTVLVDPENMPLLDMLLCGEIEDREPMSMTRFKTMVDKTILEVDPTATRKRREIVNKDRSINIRPDRHTPGQSRMSATLPAEKAAAVHARLDAMAADVHPGDPRTAEQRRLDAIVALAEGYSMLACACEECVNAVAPDETAAPEHQVPDDNAAEERTDTAVVPEQTPRPTFHIVVNLSTLLGHDDDPAYLDGHGVIDAETARSLLTGARRSFIHTDHKEAARAALRYTPSRKLAELIRCGELCCTFPGCNNPAWHADLDHTVPHGKRGGRTERRNIKPLCRFHHRLKTFGVGWRDYQDELGTVFFESPTGHMYLGNAFTGGDLFTSLRPPPASPDNVARQRVEEIRARRAGTITRADDRAEAQWNSDNPPPF